MAVRVAGASTQNNRHDPMAFPISPPTDARRQVSPAIALQSYDRL
jgi:hypothetical protein